MVVRFVSNVKGQTEMLSELTSGGSKESLQCGLVADACGEVVLHH